jgi:hypothetical protein
MFISMELKKICNELCAFVNIRVVIQGIMQGQLSGNVSLSCSGRYPVYVFAQEARNPYWRF